MALRDRFKRKKNTTATGMPAEVTEYYKAERRDKTGMAWLLAIATLLVTFLLAAGLFFGGRWAYRAVFDNDEPTVSQEEQGEESREQEGNTNQSNDTQSSNGGQTSSTNTNTTPPTTTQAPSASTPAATPNTGPSELVDTGPGDEL